MPYLRNKRTGEVIEVDASGRPVNAQRMPPPDPTFDLQAPKAQADIYNTQTNARGNEIDNSIKAATRDAAIREANARADAQVAAARKAQSELAATGSPKPDLGPVRVEAENKINLLDSLIDRSRNDLFATGAGTKDGWLWPGRETAGTNAYGTAADAKTVAASGALAKLMELAKTNGGKNPLTPISNADIEMLGNSVANLDISQPDEQFQRNAGIYRDLYARALRGAGGGLDQRRLRSLRPEDARAALEGGNASLEQQIAGYTPEEQARARAAYQRNTAIQQLSGKAPPRTGSRPPRRGDQGWWSGSAPRRSGGPTVSNW